MILLKKTNIIHKFSALKGILSQGSITLHIHCKTRLINLACIFFISIYASNIMANNAEQKAHTQENPAVYPDDIAVLSKKLLEVAEPQQNTKCAQTESNSASIKSEINLYDNLSTKQTVNEPIPAQFLSQFHKSLFFTNQEINNLTKAQNQNQNP